MNKKEKLILFVSAFGLFLYSMDSSLMNLVQPLIAKFFKTGTSEVSFVSTAYLIAAGASMLIGAQLFERYEFKKVISFGYIVFITATVSCGFSPNLWVLVFFRTLQGLGGALIFIGAFTAVSKFLPAEKMGTSFGVLSAALSGGMAAGFPIGGFITSVLSWQMVFFIQLPFVAAALFFALRIFPFNKTSNEKYKFDLPGVIVFFLALAAFTFSLSMGENFGWKSPIIIGCFLFSAAMFFLFVMRENRCKHPFFNLRIFKDKIYSMIITGRILATILQSGNLFLLPFYIIYILKLSQLEAGLVMLSYTVLYTLFAPFSGLLADRFKPERIGFIALINLFISSLFFILMVNNPGIIWIIVYLIVVSAGFAVFFPSNNKLAILFVAPEKRGLSTGIMLTVWAVGQSLGVSIFELVFSNTLYFSKYSSLSVNGEFSSLAAVVLEKGFQYAYLAGAAAVLISIFFSGIVILKMKKRS